MPVLTPKTEQIILLVVIEVLLPLRNTKSSVGTVRRLVIRLKIVSKERKLEVQGKKALANDQVKRSQV